MNSSMFSTYSADENGVTSSVMASSAFGAPANSGSAVAELKNEGFGTQLRRLAILGLHNSPRVLWKA